MDIEVKGANELILKGNIKSLKDYQNIKQTVTDMIASGVDHISIRTPESFSIT